jgi:hypothetical protein
MNDIPIIRFDETDDELGRVLAALRGVLLRHPIAAQAAFAALVTEGRRYAVTEEGAAWYERIAESVLLDRVRLIWDAAGMTAFVPEGSETLPSVFVEGVARGAAAVGLEPLLSRIFDERS